MRIITALFLFFIFSNSIAKTEFTPQLAQSYNYLFKLKLDSTQILISRSEKSAPDNKVNILMYCYVEFIRIVLSEELAVYNQWQHKFELRVNSIKKLEDESPYKQYILGEMYIQSSILKFKFGDQMGALFDFRKGYGYLADNEKDFPEFPYHKKTLGFIHILLSYIPNKYKWVIRIAGFQTDLNKGINQLNEANQNHVATRYEAYFLQLWLKIILENKVEECINTTKEFIALHPDFVVAKWSLIMLLKNENRVGEALQISDQIKPRSGFYYSPYFYFVNGQMQLYVGNYEKAIKEMSQFIAWYKGKMLRQSAFYFMYLSDYVNAKPENLELYKDSVLKTPKSGSEQDRIAQNALTENPRPNIEILKARLLFDGGRFENSLDELQKLNPENIANWHEQVEYYYRKGRAYEKLSDKANALIFYKLAIEKQKNEPLYFAPNAYLILAKLVCKEDPISAKLYLKKIDDYDNYEYQPEIEYQAKALKRKL